MQTNPIPRRILVFALLASWLAGSFVNPADAATKKKTTTKKTTVKVASRKVARKLDGVWVPKSQANKRVLAVMIENHPAVRPQAGLQDAGVVYEALAEGGIPRFMALYSNYNKVGMIGPVRSARPYYVRWAAEYGAALVHAGGSPDSQELLKKIGLRNIEGLKDPTARYFFRRGSGVHSFFTTGPLLTQANNRYPKRTPVYQGWRFVSDPPKSKRKTGHHGARVDLGPGWNYMVGYEYDRTTNTYFRFSGNKKHLDRTTRKQVTVKNVILQFVPKEKVLDRKGRIELQTLGQGKAILLKNGYAVTINWQKKSTRGRTVFTDGKGKTITLIRGNTWITAVPRGRKYSVY